ncbi:MAG: c-type cytochrome [Cyclobacteriaceae bacterium]
MCTRQIASLVILGLMVGCTSSSEQIKLKQYTAEGQKLYVKHCANCHQEDGRGLGTLYPPLAQSDFIKADVDRTICLIRYGIEGPIIVNGLQYNMVMPENSSLTPLQIAEIITFITNSWGDNKGLISVNEVEKILTSCK